MYYGNISNIILDPFHAYLSKLCRIKYSYLIFRLIIYILKKVRTIFPLAQDNIITYTFTENKPICKIISVNLFFFSFITTNWNNEQECSIILGRKATFYRPQFNLENNSILPVASFIVKKKNHKQASEDFFIGHIISKLETSVNYEISLDLA